jgi:photosystem II stability/assembly factor-like uncharacterized protein
MKTFTLSFWLLIAALMINVIPASAQWSFQTNPLSGTGDPTMVGKVQFVSSTEGWISATGGNMLHTTNAGATWTVVPVTTDSVFSISDPSFNMQFLNASTGWVMKTMSTGTAFNPSSALGAVVYYTTNGGSTWNKSVIAQGTGIIGAQLQFVDANNGFATVFNLSTSPGIGYLYKTTNGGATWTQVGSSFPGTDEVQLFYFTSSTTGCSLLIDDSTPEFKIKQTTDGGVTWTTKYNDATTHGIDTMTSCGALQFVDANNGWAVGPNSRIVKTTDGGNSWTTVTSSLTSGLNTYQKCMFMLDANHIWIGEDVPSSTTGQTTSHFLMHTADGGTTWTQDNISLASAAFSIFFWDGNTGWLTGDYSSSSGNKGLIAAYAITPPKTVNISAGGLSTALTATELNSVSNLTITGTIDARDFVTMRDNMPALSILDISGANIVAYSGSAGTVAINTTYPANEIPQNAFYNGNTYKSKTTLTSIKLPSSAVSIGQFAFLGCTGLTGTFSIPSSITSIGENAFQSCSGFTGTLTLPSLTSIGGGVFQNCTGFTGSLIIPSSFTTLNSWDFAYCTGLTSVTIPSSVTTINDNVFNGCSGLTSIYANKSTPVDLTSSPNVFSGVNYNTCTLYVPVGSKTLYQNANQWSSFVNIVEHTVTGTNNIAASAVKVSVQNHQAIITGVTVGEKVMLYSVNGVSLENQTAKAETVVINLPAKGVYLLHVGAKALKVVNN